MQSATHTWIMGLAGSPLTYLQLSASCAPSATRIQITLWWGLSQAHPETIHHSCQDQAAEGTIPEVGAGRTHIRDPPVHHLVRPSPESQPPHSCPSSQSPSHAAHLRDLPVSLLRQVLPQAVEHRGLKWRERVGHLPEAHWHLAHPAGQQTRFPSCACLVDTSWTLRSQQTAPATGFFVTLHPSGAQAPCPACSADVGPGGHASCVTTPRRNGTLQRAACLCGATPVWMIVHPQSLLCISLQQKLLFTSACASAPYPKCQQHAVKQLISTSPMLLEGAHENADEL